MGSAAWLELRQSLAGVLRLARGDRAGLLELDRSLEGFWHSFRAAVVAYPLYVILTLLQVSEAKWAASGALRILAVETIAYTIGWTAFPLVILPVTRWIGASSASSTSWSPTIGARCRRVR